MSTRAMEALLARLYTDDNLRDRFLSEPDTVLTRFDLTAEEKLALVNIDRSGLIMAAASYTSKRSGRHKRKPSFGARLRRLFSRLRGG